MTTDKGKIDKADVFAFLDARIESLQDGLAEVIRDDNNEFIDDESTLVTICRKIVARVEELRKVREEIAKR